MVLRIDVHGRDGLSVRFPRTKSRMEFDFALRDTKTALGVKWDKDNKLWYSDGPEIVLDYDRAGIRYALTPQAKMRVERLRKQFRNTIEIRRQAQSDTHEQYAFQRIGSEIMVAGKRIANTDVMGLGKTKQAIDALDTIYPKTTLVVVLKTLTHKWYDEFKKWAPHLQPMIVPDGGPGKREPFWQSLQSGDIVITNYEKLLAADFPHDFGWEVVICDEATYIKSGTAQRTRAAAKVARGAEYVWLLTGTYLETKLEDLFNIYAVYRPGVFGSFLRFRDNHLITDFSGAVVGVRQDTLPLLHERIAPWMIRRTKDDVQLQLPPKLYNVDEIEFSPDEQALYNRLRTDLESWIEEQGGDPYGANILTQMTRFQQCTSHPALIGGDMTSSKLEHLDMIVRDWDGQILIFTRFAEMAKLLIEHLPMRNDATIHGGITSAEERLRRNNAFNAGKLGRIFVMTDAGAHGLDFTTTDLVIHYDQLWNPAKLRQREDRLHRIGQTQTVNVLSLLISGTIDVGMQRVCDTRQALADSIGQGVDDVIQQKLRLNYRQLALGVYDG